jgi:NTP pyrophosphatase (non-canonical NTP hydrolase)
VNLNPDNPIPYALTPKAHAALGAFPRPADLREIARALEPELRANRRPAITDVNALDVQALCIAEEAGELVGAYRRWAGKARRTGTLRELEDELADVLITTAVFAHRAGIDLDAAVAAKLAIIYARGWRQDTPDCAA